MNLACYLIMSVFGFLSCLHEILFGRINRWLLSITIIFFIVTACTRIGYSPEGDDLAVYISFFQGNQESYFEPGYMLVTQAASLMFGDSPVVLVVSVSLWIVVFVFISAWLSEWCVTGKAYESLDECYIGTLLFVVMMYWGCFFAAETLRTGMAIVLLYSSCVLAVNGKYGLAIIPALMAPFFHLSAILFWLGLLIILVVKDLTQKQYLIWLGLIVLIDILVALFESFSFFENNDIFQTIAQVDALVHFSDYGGNVEPGPYISTQYVTYHLFGLLMLFGNLDDSRYNKSVRVYFMGLVVGTLFQSLLIVIRIQWIFLAMAVFPLYYFMKDIKYSILLRSSIAFVYAVIQGVMILRVLGWHL